MGAGLLGGLAGCTDGSAPPGATPSPEPSRAPFEHPGTLDETMATSGDFPPDDDPADGFPPTFPDPPPAPDVDTSTFETIGVNGESVALAPIDVVIDWYRRGDARFVDARGLEQYVTAHVYGAVLSTAQRESTGGPIAGWDRGSRVVTYCGCPHHLSSVRAAGLQKTGFSTVFALDDGFLGLDTSWADQGYPMAGTHFRENTPGQRADVTLSGITDRAHAGAYAWAIAEGRAEASPIDADGRYAIHLSFVGVSDRTPVTVRTPGYTVEGRLGELADGTIRPP